MSNSLYTLLNEHVLTEGRKEDVMKKYPNVSKEIIENLSQNDPSGNNKYLEFMVKEVSNGNSTADQISNIVNDYHTKLPMINKRNLQDYTNEHKDDWDESSWEKFIRSPKDINSYESLSHLRHFLDFLSKATSKKKEKQQLNKETDRIFENEDIIVVAPKTHKASCEWGRHSAWCVATSNTSHFDSYSKNGVLYFFISKKDIAYNRYWKDKDNGQPPYKTALLLKDNGAAQWWSKGDTNYTDGLDPNNEYLKPFFTEEIKNKILKHNKYVIENRKKREIEKILISSSFYKRNGNSNMKQDFSGFVRSGVYTPEQLISIIKNDNWLALYENSESGKIVRETLGKDKVYSLILELINTNPNLLLETLKDLHSQEFLTRYGNEFSDDENRNIAQTIVKKLGKKPASSEVGGDVKMYVDKWTMTPEQWEIYNNSSNYFFIGKVEPMKLPNGEIVENLNIESIYKGDRFNPSSHHALQMMMLRARMSNNKLYAITTEKDLLDEWLSKGGTDIPQPVLTSIREKAKQIG